MVDDPMAVISFGTPGAMRQSLTALVLSGHKTATAGLLHHDHEREEEELAHIGEELVVVGSDAVAVAVIAADSVEVLPFASVSCDFAEAEGEGFESIEDWRVGHAEYWRGEGVAASDGTSVVCLRFHVVSSAAR